MQRWRFKKANQNNRNQNQFLIITNKFEDAVILLCCYMQLYSKQQSCPGHLYFSFAHGTTQTKSRMCLKFMHYPMWSSVKYTQLQDVPVSGWIGRKKEKKKKEWYGYDSKFSVFKVVILSGYDSAPLSPTVLLNRKALYPMLGDLYIWYNLH